MSLDTDVTDYLEDEEVEFPDEEEMTDEQANKIGLDYLEAETEKCAKAFTEEVRRWAEAANAVIARNF